MTLRSKLLAAQVPLALAIVILGVVATSSIKSLGGRADLILRANYASVIAAERMKEAVERIDSATTFLVMGRADLAKPQLDENLTTFARELDTEDHNITELGEADAVRKLHDAWDAYRAAVMAFEPGGEAYFATLQPRFVAVKDAVDEILEINESAMNHKNTQAMRAADTETTAIMATSILALVAGVVASVWLTARLLRPLSVLRLAVRRLGEGDLAARAQIGARGAMGDEIAGLARDFNTMAVHLEQYSKSSLGELLLAQSAAQAVIDSLPDPVIVVALKGELLNANQAADQLLGVSVEKPVFDPLVRPVVERLAAHVLGGNGPFVPRGMDEAIRIQRPDGIYQLLPRATAIYGEEGGVSGVTIVLQDVTRLVRFDELKNDLVATVAHEFRTPLTSLRMAIHMCVEGAVGDLNEKQLDLLTVARDDCERLQSIVDDLLDMSRIQAGKIEIRARPIAAEGLAEEAARSFQDAAAQRGLAIRSETMPGLGEVMADPERLELVFANLITNAIRHTPEGEVVVRALPDEKFVKFEVADTGTGIPPEHQAAIFERFYRVPGTTGSGAGLGLFIVKEIVQAHGGAVGLTSGDQGTTFWFTIPVAPEERES